MFKNNRFFSCCIIYSSILPLTSFSLISSPPLIPLWWLEELVFEMFGLLNIKSKTKMVEIWKSSFSISFNFKCTWLITVLFYFHLVVAASLPSTSSPLQMREKMYLLAVGYYRSGDYSRSRHLVDRCLEVWSFVF